jgi:hypothetical protein
VSECFDALQEKFDPMFHLFYLLDMRTRWYDSPRHICSLFRQVTDFFRNQFITTIDGTSIFGGDPVDSLGRSA